jgi:hypothetical protein
VNEWIRNDSHAIHVQSVFQGSFDTREGAKLGMCIPSTDKLLRAILREKEGTEQRKTREQKKAKDD